MKSTWIVLANAARARIFNRDPGSGHLQELADLIHPESREHGRDLDTDRPGHAQKGHGDAGHAGTAFQPHTGALQREHTAFALEVARYLDRAAVEGRCAELVLIASDPFLGGLKSHLGASSRHMIRDSVPRDLTSFTGKDLEDRVSDAMGQAHH